MQAPGSERASRRRDLPAELGSPGEARAMVRSACLAWDIDDEVSEDAALVATELVANVVDHAGTPCTLIVGVDGDELLIDVRDFFPCPPPQALPADPNGPRGRGLLVVAAVSSRWGVTPFPDGKSVWALLPVLAPRAALHDIA